MLTLLRDNLLPLLGAPNSPLRELLAALLLSAIFAGVAVLADWLCRRLLVPLVTKVTSKTRATWDDVLLNRQVLNAACHIVPAVILWRLLPIAFAHFPDWAEAMNRLCGVWITVMATRTGILFLNSFKFLQGEGHASGQQYLQSFCGILKVIVLSCAVIVVAAILIGKSPVTLFAGLGATSAVLMLVFKDTIEGLVAGVRLNSNDMVHVGDWITVAGTEVHGTVEEISLTTVKVRNFDNTIVTISPKALVEGSFQNWKGMKERPGRRMKRVIHIDLHSIRLASAELKARLVKRGWFSKKDLAGEVVNLALFRNYAERYLQSRPDVELEGKLMLRQLEATDTGLPIEVYCFLKDQEWVAYEHAAADLMEHLIALVPEFDLAIYQRYPTYAKSIRGRFVNTLPDPRPPQGSQD